MNVIKGPTSKAKILKLFTQNILIILFKAPKKIFPGGAGSQNRSHA